MKVKNFIKKIISINSPLLAIASIANNINMVQQQSDENSDNLLSLELTEGEEQKLKNLNFKYKENQDNIIYITDSTKDEIAKEIVFYMLRNESSFFDNSLSSLDKELRPLFVDNSVKKLKYSELTNSGNWNFYYLAGRTTDQDFVKCLKGNVKNVMQYVKWNNVGNDRYTLSLLIPFSYYVSLTYSNEQIKSSKWEGGTFIKRENGKRNIDLSFNDIYFEVLPSKITTFKFTDLDIMELTNTTLKSLFLFDNILEPSEILRSVIREDSLYKVNVTRLVYSVNGNQSFFFSYQGFYSLSFVESDYSFNWYAIESTYSAFTITKDILIDNLLINKYYKKYINNVKIVSDYDQSKCDVEITFNVEQASKLIFYDFIKDYFNTYKTTLNFTRNTKVTFFLKDGYKNILLKNFKEEYLAVKFINYPDQVNITKTYNTYIDTKNNRVDFDANIVATIENEKYPYTISGYIEGFETYTINSLEKIQTFFDNNFYDEYNNFDKDQVIKVFEIQNYWNYLCTYSKNLVFKNPQVNLDNENKKINFLFDVFNNNGVYQDSNSFTITLKDPIKTDDDDIEEPTIPNQPSQPSTPNQPNSPSTPNDNSEPEIINKTESKFNKNYLFFLLLIVPIIVVAIIKIFKKLKQNRNKI